LDRQRQENREALTALRKQPGSQNKAWLRLKGGILVKMGTQQAKDTLQSGEGGLVQGDGMVMDQYIRCPPTSTRRDTKEYTYITHTNTYKHTTM
jgi:hypothetical protein